MRAFCRQCDRDFDPEIAACPTCGAETEQRAMRFPADVFGPPSDVDDPALWDAESQPGAEPEYEEPRIFGPEEPPLVPLPQVRTPDPGMLPGFRTTLILGLVVYALCWVLPLIPAVKAWWTMDWRRVAGVVAWFQPTLLVGVLAHALPERWWRYFGGAVLAVLLLMVGGRMV